MQRRRDHRRYSHGVIFSAVLIKKIKKVLKTFDAAGGSFGFGVLGIHHQRTVHLNHFRAIQPVGGPGRVYRIDRQVREYPVRVWMQQHQHAVSPDRLYSNRPHNQPAQNTSFYIKSICRHLVYVRCIHNVGVNDQVVAHGGQ